VDAADVPVHLDPPTQLQLREHDITSVLWCTGYADAVAAALRNGRRPAMNQASLVRHWACQTLGTAPP
jgi:hypothetical protein